MIPPSAGVSIALSCALSATVSLLVVLTARWHLHLSADSQWHLPQKIHRGEIPRIGGVAIVAGFVAALLALELRPEGRLLVSPTTAALLVAGVAPVFAIGLAEDLTKRVGARLRLLWMSLGAVVLIEWRELLLSGIDAPLLDPLFSGWGFALAFSVFACVGAANAYNIVDGLNGLLGGVSLITLAAVAATAASVGDAKVLTLATLLGAAIAGWLPFNWPRARLFAGDAGAYSIGFLTAALLLLLVLRNPGAVTPWFGLTAAALPVWETVYSIWRRLRRGAGAMEADEQHLHQLVRRALHRARQARALARARRRALDGTAGDARRRLAGIEPPNGSASPWLWALHAAAAALGVRFHGGTLEQLVVFVGFAVGYVVLHGRLQAALAPSDPGARPGVATAGIATAGTAGSVRGAVDAPAVAQGPVAPAVRPGPTVAPAAHRPPTARETA